MLRVTVQPHLPDLEPVSGSLRRAWMSALARPKTSSPVPDWARESFARVAEAAARAGIHPGELEAEAFPGSRFAELAEARDWSEATCCKYAKAGWAHGLALPRIPTPEPLGGPATLPELYLVDDGSPPTVIRAAVWCRLATVWPAPVTAWAALKVTDVEVEGDDVRLHPVAFDEDTAAAPDDPGPSGRPGPTDPDAPSDAIARVGIVRVVGAGELTRRWLDWRKRLPGDALLCTLRAGPGTLPGSPMADRTLEVAFRAQAVRAIALAGELGTRHDDERRLARRDTYETLTYDTYRRLLLDAGVPPVTSSTRGAVRAKR